MRKINILFLISLMFFLFINSVYAIDKESLWSLLTFADTPDLTLNAQIIAIENPSILEEILFISDNEKDNSIAREQSLILLTGCSLNGKISKESFYNDVFRLLSQASSFIHSSRIENEKKLITTILGNYAFDQIHKTSLLSIPENFSCLLLILDSMSLNGLINNDGTLKSLKSKISNAKELLEKKTPNGKTAAINKIEAAINEAEAQKGNHLTTEAAMMFVTYCQNLIALIKATSF